MLRYNELKFKIETSAMDEIVKMICCNHNCKNNINRTCNLKHLVLDKNGLCKNFLDNKFNEIEKEK